jgi:hypothetical protein
MHLLIHAAGVPVANYAKLPSLWYLHVPSHNPGPMLVGLSVPCEVTANMVPAFFIISWSYGQTHGRDASVK